MKAKELYNSLFSDLCELWDEQSQLVYELQNKLQAYEDKFYYRDAKNELTHNQYMDLEANIVYTKQRLECVKEHQKGIFNAREMFFKKEYSGLFDEAMQRER